MCDTQLVIKAMNDRIDRLQNELIEALKPKRKCVQRTKKKKYGEYKHVLLSDDDHKKLVEKWADKLDYGIEVFDTYMETSGRRYENHYRMLLSGWPAERIEQGKRESKIEEVKRSLWK